MPVSQGSRAGLIWLAGVAFGFFTYLLAAAAGIAAPFALVPEIYLAIKLAGAAYLAWLAWKTFCTGGLAACSSLRVLSCSAAAAELTALAIRHLHSEDVTLLRLLPRRPEHP
jgi:threonine/homoserine/homoserine lactone efflux protein